jgi:hypothetical protein
MQLGMKKGVILAGCVLFAAAAFAQRTPVLDRHQSNQRLRIADGIRDGDLSRLEAHRLIREQRGLRRMERLARADGQVTPRERVRLHRRQHLAGRHIYRMRNNGQ